MVMRWVEKARRGRPAAWRRGRKSREFILKLLLNILMSEINIKIKLSNGSTFDVAIPGDATISDLKAKCAGPSGIEADDQRLIYKGRAI